MRSTIFGRSKTSIEPVCPLMRDVIVLLIIFFKRRTFSRRNVMTVPLSKTTAERLIECAHNVIANIAFDGLGGGEMFTDYINDPCIQFPHKLWMYVFFVVEDEGRVTYNG